MFSRKESILSASLLLALLVASASAAPYYYFWGDDAVQKAADVVQGAVNNMVGNGQPDHQAPIPPSAPLQEKFVNHLSHFYDHGKKAVQGAYENISPDLKDIGGDISEAARMTSENVKTKVAPLEDKVKPIIDQAGKAVAPYVNRAREEVPKLIEQAKPAISKGLNDLYEKIKTVGGGSQTPATGASGPQVTQSAGYATHGTGDQSATNTIQQAGQQIANKVQEATQSVSQ